VSDEDDTRVYLDPLESIGHLSRMNFRAFSQELEKQTAIHGVSSSQWWLLRILWEQDDITQRELCDKIRISEATMVKAINGLVAAGLAERHRSTSDKRKYNIKLTHKAKKLEGKLLPLAALVNEHAAQGISKKDIDTTHRVLAKTFENLMAGLSLDKA
jgi:DNA-binding MarR family transcriptional regulator